MRGWGWGNFAAVAALSAASFGLHEWRGGYSSSFLFHGTALLLGIAFFSMCFGIRRIRAERQLPQSRFFAGEDAHVIVTIRRSGPIPSGWMIVSDVWTDGRSEYRHSRLLFPGFRSVLRFRYKLNKLARGRYRFIRVEVDAGDWMGLLRKRVIVPLEAELAVYPKPLSLVWNRRGVSAESGKLIVAARLANEPASVVTGVRPYTAGDPLQRIHWKATARTGLLQTKSADPFESDKIAVMLDGSRGGFSGQDGDARFEAGVRAAAGLLEWTAKRGTAASLHTGSDRPSLPLARRSDMADALELLSRARADGDVSGADMLLRESAGWPNDCSVVLVTGCFDEALLRAAVILRSGRRSLTVWFVQTDSPLADKQRYWMQQLESSGCRVDVLHSPRPHLYSPGGAEDVTA
ncbi:DUF58 domain-containing protein [Paenibacillus mesophilus]|uniref:DUF58 domain-containing protein n=1 Tax=Paenibacillus mesophilus TaxID=2582849 RepID=UPI00110EB7AF|nr:DUF58 domain-containing protein [Paenibacillus mesophilus]TMV44445.1 DUF58 domain-containing protein [Paenibacillus mesophilus]